MLQNTQPARTNELWIIGATGRIGGAVAARIVANGLTPVLVGRDRECPDQVGAGHGQPDGVKLVIADVLEASGRRSDGSGRPSSSTRSPRTPKRP